MIFTCVAFLLASFLPKSRPPQWCKPKAEDENDDEDENDWGSGGRELRPTIAGIVRLKTIDQFKSL
jgi:hypothetical protein